MSAMPHAAREAASHDVSALASTTASELQKGWRGVVKLVRAEGRVAVTNHGDPEVVVLSLGEYERLHGLERELAGLAGGTPLSPVEELTRRFKARMASRDPAAFDRRLDEAAATPARPGGRLRVDDRF